jgi:hypothetical protein
MNYDEFIRDGRPRYELFAKTVAAILQAAIDTGPREDCSRSPTERKTRCR